MVNLTETQKQAVETVDLNVCVSAGAGTGKTRVLVERFLHLIKHGFARSGEILAITYTEKAAHEMKARIARGLSERGLNAARRELENAYIGTIHAFCSRVLREHPLEAEVDPKFRILEETESVFLKNQVWDKLVETRFQEPSIFELLQTYSEDGIRDTLFSVFCRKQTFDPGKKDWAAYGMGNSVEWNQLESFLMEQTRAAFLPLKSYAEKHGDDFSLILASFEKQVKTWEDVEELKTIRQKFRRQGKWAEAVDTFRAALDDWIAYSVEALAKPHWDTFLSLLEDFENQLKSAKEEAVVLDFSDLERKAFELLSGVSPAQTAIRSLYRERFKFVMVDEFQDTSAIQNELIALISNPTNLFIVGDAKQSIYGFRGTDTALFLNREAQFEKEGTSKVLVLNENFRSQRGVLDFVNSFFQKLWLESTKKFEPLLLAETSSLNGSAARDRSEPSVELITIEQKDKETVEEGRMREARALAIRIRELVDSGACGYGDIAMLFRASTDMYFYEHELRNLHIPFYTISGRGFYHQPEVRDLILFLETLENPYLDIPLASVLRSPLVQVTDDTLFWLTNISKEKSKSTPLYVAVLACEAINEISEADQNRLIFFKSLFTRLLAEKEKWSVSECIEQILSETSYDRYVLGLPHGKRHFANLRKLIEVARELESRDAIHLGDFVRLIKEFQVDEVRELEAQIEAEEGEVVKLMTIHKAKGLEFGTVMLPDLSRKNNGGFEKILVDQEFGFGLKGFNECSGEFEKGFFYKKIEAKRKAHAHDELKRLLYVAMTRAKNQLIFSGLSKSSTDVLEEEIQEEGEKSWYELIDDFVSHNAASGALNTRVTDPSYQVKCLPSSIVETQIGQALRALEPVEVGGISDEAEKVIERLKPFIPPSFERLDLPVSAYLSFEHDPLEYKRTYECGGVLPTPSTVSLKLRSLSFPRKRESTDSGSPLKACGDDKGVWGKERNLSCTTVLSIVSNNGKNEEESFDEDETLLSSTEFGTVVHQIFEFLVTNPKQAEKRVSEILRSATSNLELKDQKEIEKLTHQFIASSVFGEIRNAKMRYSEIPFVLRLHSGLVQGVLDLLYECADGSWVILDYKTNQISDLEVEQTAERYKTQMMFYALACHELLHIPVKRATLYFARLDKTYDFSLGGLDFQKLRRNFELLQSKVIQARKEWQLSACHFERSPVF